MSEMRTGNLNPEHLKLRLQQIRPPAGTLASGAIKTGIPIPQTFREAPAGVYLSLGCSGTLRPRSRSYRLHQTGRTINPSSAV